MPRGKCPQYMQPTWLVGERACSLVPRAPCSLAVLEPTPGEPSGIRHCCLVGLCARQQGWAHFLPG